MASPADSNTDGRIQRSERSREAIVQAMLDLIGEGNLYPTAQQVAARADVGVRTVFRHFSDMDSLFIAMNERMIEEVDSLFVKDVQMGPLSVRCEALLDTRLRFFEHVAPYFRSAARQRFRSDFLQEQHQRNVRSLRRDLRRWLPELADHVDLAAAVELVLSFEAYDRLRNDQRLGAKRIRAVLHQTLHALLEKHAGHENERG